MVWNMQEFTAEYRFAEDLVNAVVQMRTVYESNVLSIKIGKSFITDERKKKIKDFFSKERFQLDKFIEKYTRGNEGFDFSDHRFLLCVERFEEEYKHRHGSEEEFLIVCSKIAYVAATFLKKNGHLEVIRLTVDRVYEMLIDTFYPTIIEEGTLVKDISDHKYRFAYNLVKKLTEIVGVSVPDLEMSIWGNFYPVFNHNHNRKIKILFSNERTILDTLIKSFICSDGKPDYKDENMSRCMDEILKRYGSDQITEDEVLLVCARVAYVAALFVGDDRLNVIDLAVNRVYKILKKRNHLSNYTQDDCYSFACDLVKIVVDIRSGSLSVAEKALRGNSFFIISHQDKLGQLLTIESYKLDALVKKIIGENPNLNYHDTQFILCMDQMRDDYKSGYKSTQEIVSDCMRIAYVAACFSWKNSTSHAPRLALDHILEIIKDISFADSEELIMHTQDNYFRFAHDLVQGVLEMTNNYISGTYLSHPRSFSLKVTDKNKMKDLILKEKSQLAKIIEEITNECGFPDYGDSNFIRCMFKVKKKYRSDHMESISTRIAYMAACFLKKNCYSNATFLAVNHIYKLIKQINPSTSPKDQYEYYCLAYERVKAVLDINLIHRSPLVLPNADNLLFTEIYRSKIHTLLLKESIQLDNIVENLINIEKCGYSDNKFLQCLDHVVKNYKSGQGSEEGFVYLCARIAYIAARFSTKKSNSNAIFLAVNRIYEMSKESNHFSQRMVEEAWAKDEVFNLTYDLLKTAFQIRSNSSNVGKILSTVAFVSGSCFKILNKSEIQHFLSVEWPNLHRIVRKFASMYGNIEFGDNQFLQCIRKIINDFAYEQKNEIGLLIACARIAYVASCFRRENEKSNAIDLAIYLIRLMRKNSLKNRDTGCPKSLIEVDVEGKKYYFHHNLVKILMELQNTQLVYAELPDTNHYLNTSRDKKEIEKPIHNQNATLKQSKQ